MDDARDRFSTQSTRSSSALKAALIARQAKILFAAYRRDEFADPEGFIAQLGVVLEGFTDAVILAVTDPRTGIQRRLKWPPSIAELVEACESETVRQSTIARYAAMPRPQFLRLARPIDRSPGRRANVFVHADAPQYQAALEWAQSAEADGADWKDDPEGRPGIWIALDKFDRLFMRVRGNVKPFRTMTDDELRVHYGMRPTPEPRRQEAAE